MNPEWPEAYRMLEAAEKQIELGEVDAGMELCRKAASLAPDDDRIWLSYGWIASGLDLREEAKAAMKRAVEIDPADSANWLGFGYALSELGEHAEAVEAFRRVRGSHEYDYIQALSCLAFSYVHTGRVTEAIENTEKALDLAKDAPDLLAKIEQRAASTAEVLLDRAELRLEAGDENRALEIGRQATRISKDPYIHFDFGVLAREAGAFAEAKEAILRACQLEPTEHPFWFSLGNVNRNLGLLDEAVECYRHSLLLEPKFVDSMNNLGLTLYDLHRYQEAEEVLLRSLSLSPDDPMLHQNLGAVYWETDRREEALRAYRQSEKLDPYDRRTLEHLAEILLELGKSVEASAIQERLERVSRMLDQPPRGLS